MVISVSDQVKHLFLIQQEARCGWVALPAASLTRMRWFSTGSLLTWAAGKNVNANLAQVHKVSIQSANDRLIMDGRINKAWHEFYIPDPAGNEVKWVLNVTLTTVTDHKSLFCANLHAFRFHKSNNRRRNLFEFCPPIIPYTLSPLCDGVGHGWPLLPDTVPLRSHARDEARTRKRSHLRLRYRKNTKDQNSQDFPNPWHVSAIIKEEKLAPNPKITWGKKRKTLKKADWWNKLAAFHSCIECNGG